MLKRVTLFGQPGCHLCEHMELRLQRIRQGTPFDLEVVNIMSDPALAVEYGFDIPVIAVEGIVYSKHYLNEEAFEAHIKELGLNHANTS